MGIAAIVFLVLSQVAVAQNNPVPGADTLQKGKCHMAQEQAMPGPAGAPANCPRWAMDKGRPCPTMQGNMLPGCGPWNMCQKRPFPHRFLLLKLCFGCALLGMILYLAINILLTIIVASDMQRRGCFSGLWIPLLLIAGIPTTVVYALFRIGDNLKDKKA